MRGQCVAAGSPGAGLLFASDLDNTLIYSRRHGIPGGVCVETLHGAQQSFLSPRTRDLLEQVCRKAALVPVTTRSVEQYLRLAWPPGCAPRYAVAANGAVLLKDGVRVPGWREESEEELRAWREVMLSLMPEFSDPDRYPRCRVVDEAYLFVLCADEAQAVDGARVYAGLNGLTAAASGRKLYFFPPLVNKGRALARLKERFAPAVTVSAGDSVIDLPMLCEADVAVVPAGLDARGVSAGAVRRCPPDRLLSEFALEVVLTSFS